MADDRGVTVGAGVEVTVGVGVAAGDDAVEPPLLKTAGM